jgi:hypothetical protein
MAEACAPAAPPAQPFLKRQRRQGQHGTDWNPNDPGQGETAADRQPACEHDSRGDDRRGRKHAVFERAERKHALPPTYAITSATMATPNHCQRGCRSRCQTRGKPAAQPTPTEAPIARNAATDTAAQPPAYVPPYAPPSSSSFGPRSSQTRRGRIRSGRIPPAPCSSRCPPPNSWRQLIEAGPRSNRALRPSSCVSARQAEAKWCVV